MEEKKANKGKFFINLIIVLVIIFISVFLYARYTEHTQLITKEYRLISEKIPSNFSGIKIIQFSDLYYGNTTGIEEVELLVEKINILKPDIIIFTGNLFGNNTNDKDDKLKDALSKINAKIGKYAVKGINDYFENYESFMKDIDFKVLKNEYELIYNEGLIPIYLCGLNSSLKEEINFEVCNENNNTSLYRIYLVHESDVSDKIMNESNPDLILSGNSLGGLINVPLYGKLFTFNGSKKYMEEYYNINGVSIYVSSGIGTSDLPYRFLNKPSFNLYRLKSLK